jgi:hypothetical protein
MRVMLFLAMTVLLVAAFVPMETASAQDDECIIDLMLVFDGSGSIPPDDFVVMKIFIQQLVNAFEIGPDASRIGMLQFSDTAELYITLSDDADLINAAIDNMTQFGNYTNLARAISLASDQFVQPRGDVPRAMILLTDGLHNLEGDPIREAQTARDAGIEIFGVAVGAFDTSELMAIAGAEENLIQVGSFAGLSSIADNLLSSACGVTVETVELPTPIPATVTPIRTPVPTLTSSPTSAAPSRTGIVFVSDSDGDREIFVIDPVSSELQQLTDNSVDDNYPAWSPDGGQIAWVAGNDIWVMNADGSSPMRLTDDAAQDFDPAWSPDGLQIAYASDRNGDADIWLMDSGGGNAQVIIQNADATDRAPSFSPDSESLVYMSDVSGGRELYVYNLSDGGTVRLTDNGVYDGLPDWQSDGPLIVFATVRAAESSGEYEIYVTDSGIANADQDNARQITANTLADDDPAWSPDGESIVYQTFADGHWNLWIIEVATGTSRALMGGPANDTSPDW